MPPEPDLPAPDRDADDSIGTAHGDEPEPEGE